MSGLTTQVYPIYSSDLSRVLAQEDGEVFYRDRINGSFKFVRADYDYINSLDIEDEILFEIQKYDEALGWQTYWNGVFYKTDCEFEGYDSCGGGGVVEVTPEPVDNYKTLMEGLDKEFNLIDLAPAITPITYARKAILQIYVDGGDFIQNYVDGNYWESQVSTPTFNGGLNTLINDYFFTFCGRFRIIPGSGDLTPDVAGLYDDSTLIRDDGAYQIAFNAGANRWEILDLGAGSAVVYQAPIGDGLDSVNPFEGGAVFTSSSDPGSQCQLHTEAVYARVLTNAATFDGNPTDDFPADDFTGENFNYTKIGAITVTSFVQSDGHQADPTPWRVFEDTALHFAGEYFTRPSLPVGAVNLYPFGRSQWRRYSMWFYFTTSLLTTLEDGDDSLTLTDAYKLSDAINALLGAIDPTITFTASIAGSLFFYADTFDTAEKLFAVAVRGTPVPRTPMITPKSNVIFGDYDQPAKRAPIRLREIFNFLKNFYQVYWYLDGTDLRLEHLTFFEQGGAYSTNVISTDLTTALEPKTGKAWAYGTNRWKYEKSELPERLEFSWMDDSTPVFEGLPIEVVSNFVDKGNIEEKNLSPFTSDITQIQVSPSDIAKDGFVWIEAVSDGGGGLEIPFVDVTLEGETFSLQNGYMTLVFGHATYWRFQLPAPNVIINGAAAVVGSIKKKVQELTFPDTTEPDPMQLITTTIGSGKVKEMEVNLITGAIKLMLYHATQ